MHKFCGNMYFHLSSVGRDRRKGRTACLALSHMYLLCPRAAGVGAAVTSFNRLKHQASERGLEPRKLELEHELRLLTPRPGFFAKRHKAPSLSLQSSPGNKTDGIGKAAITLSRGTFNLVLCGLCPGVRAQTEARGPWGAAGRTLMDGVSPVARGDPESMSESPPQRCSP